MSGLETSLSPEEQEVLKSLQGTLPTIKPSLGYRIGMVFVTGIMLLMPLIYLGLIGSLGWAVVYHATEHYHWLKAGLWSAVVFYPFPLIAGLILLFFLVKPLFRSRAEDPPHYAITEAEQPFLFAFVYRLCDTVGAPRPKEIHLSCDVNAGAGFVPSFFGILKGELVLTLGLPLMAGLELKQVAGILAHEFGHFAQDAGMRFMSLIHTFYFWFFRITYERDEWDLKLTQLSEQMPLLLALPLWLARAMLWLTRMLLQILMFFGQLFGSYMMRQMEYDADRYESRLVGHRVFERNTRELRQLEFAMQKSLNDLRHAWDGGHLTTDLPRLIAMNKDNLNDEELEEITTRIEETEGHIFEIHPTDKERIASVKEEAPPALFSHNGSATLLVRDFDDLSERLTRDFYERLFGEDFNEKSLESPETTMERQSLLNEGRDAISRHLQDTLLEPYPLFLDEEEVAEVEDVEAGLEQLVEQRHLFMRRLLSFQRLVDAYADAEDQLVRAVLNQALMTAGFQSPDPDLLSIAQCSDLAEDSTQIQEELEEEMVEFRQLTRERLVSALSLLKTPEFATRLEDAEEWNEELPMLLKALKRLEEIFPEYLLQIRHDIFALETLLGNVDGNEGNPQLLHELMDLARHIYPTIKKARKKIQGTRYPFEHHEGDISIATYALKDMPDKEDIDGILGQGPMFVERLYLLYHRIMGRLCTFAEAVEEEAGLRPLQLPE